MPYRPLVATIGTGQHSMSRNMRSTAIRPERIGVLIPVSMESRRLPGKPLRRLWGEPLCWWPYRHACDSGAAGVVSLVTDSPEVRDWAKGADVRCWYADASAATGSDRLAAAINDPDAGFGNLEIVLDLQCDEPDLQPQEIARLVGYLAEHRGAVVATYSAPWGRLSRWPEWESPDEVKVVVDRHDRAVYFSRQRIGTPQCTYKHVGVYCYRRNVLESFGRYPRAAIEVAESLEQLRLLDNGVPIHTLYLPRPVCSVNTEEDLGCLESSRASTSKK